MEHKKLAIIIGILLLAGLTLGGGGVLGILAALAIGFFLIFQHLVTFAIFLGTVLFIILATYLLWKLLHKRYGYINKLKFIGVVLFTFTLLFFAIAIAAIVYVCSLPPPDGFCFFAGLPFFFVGGLTAIVSSIFFVINFFRKPRVLESTIPSLNRPL